MNIIPPYTREAPTRPGYYWMRDEGMEHIVEIWNDPGHPSDEPVFFIHSCGSGEVSDLTASPHAEWAGPILPPEASE